MDEVKTLMRGENVEKDEFIIKLKVEKIELEKVFDVFTKKKNTKKEEEEEDKTIDSVEKFEI